MTSLPTTELRSLLIASLIATSACVSSSGAPSSTTGGASVPIAVSPAPLDARVSAGTNVDLTVPVTVAADTLLLPADVAWSRLPAAYASFGLMIDAADPARQSLGTTRFRVRRYLHGEPVGVYLYCGRSAMGDNADTYDVEMRVRTTIESVGVDRTIIRTLVAAVAGQSGAGQSTFRCASTRVLERRLAAFVQLGAH